MAVTVGMGPNGLTVPDEKENFDPRPGSHLQRP